MKRFMPLAVILTVILIGALAVSPVFGGNHGVEGAKNAQKGLNDQVLPNSDVVGTAVGLKDGQVVLKVFTARQGVAGIPKKHDGFDVVVQVTGRINVLPPRAEPDKSGSSQFTSRVSLSAQDTFARPIPIGVSTGNERLIKYRGRWYCTVGTLAARVVDGNGNVFALSNNHVYALENKAELGDNILQPGRVDMPSGGCGSSSEISAALIGSLADYEPLVFGGGTNTIDAALAATTTSDLGNATPAEGYGLPTSSTADASLDMLVQKYGRTTELTHGTVTGINATINIGYDGGTATFTGQILVENAGGFILPGDSGSLLVTDDGNVNPSPLGLLFAGNSSGSFAIANDIDVVLSRFGVTIDGKPDAPATTGSIAGTVTSGGSLAAGATVSVETGQSGDTDVNGDYAISSVPTGDRSVTASASGYGSVTRATAVNENQITIVDFALTAVPVDETAPVISAVAAGNVTADSATITWTTDEAADSRVDYGLDTGYGASNDDSGLTTSHSIALSGLTAKTTYHYQVTSADSSGNSSSSGDFTFTTAAAPDVGTIVSVTSITYATEGGKNGDKHLLITLTLQDDLVEAVAGASGSIALKRDGSVVASGTGTTGSGGTLTFSMKNASAGAYTTTVTGVTADGLTWDGVTPSNGPFDKTGGGRGNSAGLNQ